MSRQRVVLLVALAALGAPLGAEDRRPAPAIFSTRDVRVHFELECRGAARLARFILYYTADGGQRWSRYDPEHRGDGPLTFSAPTDGRYGLTVIARDSLGQGEPAPQPGSRPETEIIVDTTPPAIEVLRPHNERGIYSSMPLDIYWHVTDDHLGAEPVEVAYSVDEGPWTPIWRHAPATAQRQWVVPFTRGRLRLRVRARDRAGNVAETVTPRVTLFERREEVERLLLVRPISRERTIPVFYRFQDDEQESLQPAALRGVRLWYREGSGEWKDGGLDVDRNSPFQFRAPADGLYQLYICAEDRRGRVHPAGSVDSFDTPPPTELMPHGTVLVDTLEPRIRIIEPRSGAVLGADRPLKIRYEIVEEHALDGAAQIHFSLDGGDHWTRLPAAGDLEAVDGRRRFRGELEFVVPPLESEEVLLAVAQRDTAGNLGRTMTDPQDPIRLRSLREDPRDEARKLHESALLALSQPERSRKLESLDLFRRALERWEPVAEVHHDYAVALQTTSEGEEKRDEILEHYRRAQELDPAHLAIRLNHIGYLLQLWKSTGAERWFGTAREEFDRIDPADLTTPGARDDERGERDERSGRHESPRRVEELRRQYEKWRDEYFPER